MISANARLDVAATFRVLDAERIARELAWAAVARALHIAASTLPGLRKRTMVKADGVLFILQ